MKAIERDATIKSVGYESLVWVRDEEGAEFSCTVGDGRNVSRFDQLSDSEKRTCMNVNQIIGTERW